ncbi:MAG TPA: hypothetical protein VFA62_08850 [Acidimicrobiia bacterium]|nr:hypothetical protein [Acidimicrobiia bacterium]
MAKPTASDFSYVLSATQVPIQGTQVSDLQSVIGRDTDMPYYGDFRVGGGPIYMRFPTLLNGAPTTLSSSPTIGVFKNGSTTPTATAAVVLTVDAEGTGRHLVTITPASDATLFTAGEFDVKLTGGKVGTLNAAGNEIGCFSIENRSALMAITAGRKLLVDASGFVSLAAASVQSVWDALTSALTTTGSIGKRLADFITGDAYARLGAPTGASVSADVAAVKSDTGTLTSRLTAGRATNLDNLDALVSSRLPTSSYTAPDNASVAAIKTKTDNLPTDPASNTQVNTRLATSGYTAPDNASITAIKAKTDALPTDPADASDVAAAVAGVDTHVLAVKAKTDLLPSDPASNTHVDTRLAASSYVAPDNASVTAIKTKTDALPASPAAVGDIPTVAEIADGVWDEDLAGHATAGSAGKALTDAATGAGGGGAPTAAEVADAVWDEDLSGHAGAGSAGAALDGAAAGGADPWLTPLPGAYAPGTAGAVLGALPADPASQAAVDAETAAIQASVDVLVARLTATRATNLDHLDVDVSTRLASAAITLASGKVVPVDVDGLSYADAMTAIMAVLFGVTNPVGSTVAFMQRDGTTTKVTITYGLAEGERTLSAVA